MITRILLVTLAMSGAAAAAWAEAPVVPTPHVYLSATAGIARWDKHSFESAEIPDRTAPLYGGRIGYTPIEAFSGEFVLLTGRNDVKVAGTTSSVRLTTAEVSLLVNFRTLMDTPVYPFLALGAGASIRRGPNGVPAEVYEFDDTHFNFHLGGGMKMDLTPRWGARFIVRDTFFTDTQVEENLETQVTVDAIEVSASIEYRIPFGRTGGPKRLR